MHQIQLVLAQNSNAAKPDLYNFVVQFKYVGILNANITLFCANSVCSCH